MKIFFCLIATILSLSLNAQSKNDIMIVEDGKKPQMNRWAFEGPVTDDSGIDYMAGDKGRGSVVRLKGFGLNNSFIFKGIKGTPISVGSKNILQWKMKY